MHGVEVQIHIASLVKCPIAVGEGTHIRHFASVHADVRKQLVDGLKDLEALFLWHSTATLSVHTLKHREWHASQPATLNQLDCLRESLRSPTMHVV